MLKSFEHMVYDGAGIRILIMGLDPGCTSHTMAGMGSCQMYSMNNTFDMNFAINKYLVASREVPNPYGWITS